MLSIDGLERLIEPVLEQLGLVLHEVELRREGKALVLCVVADRAVKASARDGVTIDELTTANREIGAVLDLEDPIDGRYRLTIESPGIERNLVTWRQVKHSVGEVVHVVLRGDGGEVVDGTLAGTSEEGERRVDVDVAGEKRTLDYAQVKSIQTVFVWPK